MLGSDDATLVKSWLQSKAVWGGIVGAAGGLLSLGHYTLSSQDAAQVVDAITGIISLAGSILAIYGRVVATHQIGPATPPSDGGH